MKNEEFNLIIEIKKNKAACRIESIGIEDKKCLKYVNKKLKQYRKNNGLSEVALFMKITILQSKEGYHGPDDCVFSDDVVSKVYFGRIEDFDRVLSEL